MAADGPAPAPRNVCFTMHGIGVSGGIAIGHAHLFLGMSTEVDHYEIPAYDVSREQRRYDRAVKEVRDELKELADSVRHSASSELAPFVNVHLMLLEDSAFSEAPREIIKEQRCNAEWALRAQLDELTAQFDEIEDEYLREREADVRQVAERVLAALAGSQAAHRHQADAPGHGHDPGRARPLARRRDPLPRAPVRGVRDRHGWRHVAHGDRRPLARHPRHRRPAPLAHDDPRGRAHRGRRHAGRAHRQPRPRRPRGIPPQAEPGEARARQAEAPEDGAGRHARRDDRAAATPTSSCRRTSSACARAAPPASASSAASSCS